MKFKTNAETLTDLTEVRHYLHQHPELSSHEYETSAMIEKYLTDLGYRIITPSALETGVIAEIGPETAESVIALRADIDALPIAEKTELAFSSDSEGVMHACGHDFHMASLLGTANLLKQNEGQLTSRVRLVFQPAEETHVGAQAVLAAGGLDDVDVIIGFHNDPTLPVGKIGVSAGPQNAAVDQFKVTFQGVGGHAARPHQNLDPIVGLANTITALQTIVSRNVNPLHPSVLSITHLEGGSTWNVIPDDAWLEGTIRTFNEEDRNLMKQKFYRVVEGQAETYGLQVDVDWIEGPPVLENDAELAPLLANEIKQHVDLVDIEPTTGGEDFAFYTDKVPSIFAVVGSGGNSGLHHSDLIIDDKGIETAIQWYYQSVLRLQKHLN